VDGIDSSIRCGGGKRRPNSLFSIASTQRLQTAQIVTLSFARDDRSSKTIEARRRAIARTHVSFSEQHLPSLLSLSLSLSFSLLHKPLIDNDGNSGERGTVG
jgi:hypothetical protein